MKLQSKLKNYLKEWMNFLTNRKS